MNQSQTTRCEPSIAILPESPRHVILRDLSVAVLALDLLREYESLPPHLRIVTETGLGRLHSVIRQLNESWDTRLA
ncbi:MAG TPA: hypothetical protein VGW38_07685 [Chloroflexota bacterium]|nr:hypothetical protein [Chloroflexota bacterium]